LRRTAFPTPVDHRQDGFPQSLKISLIGQNDLGTVWNRNGLIQKFVSTNDVDGGGIFGRIIGYEQGI
jgi:hypothetical protein